MAAEVFLATAGLGLLLRLALAVLATLPFDPGAGWRAGALGPGLLYAGLAGALLGALRLRRGGRGWQRLVVEAAGGLLVVAGAGAGVALVGLMAPGPLPVGPAPGRPAGDFEGSIEGTIQTTLLAAFSAALGALLYGATRATMLAWGAWGRHRRRRLLWSLTHAQLSVTLTLAAALAATLTLRDYHAREDVLAGTAGASAVSAGAALDQVLHRLAAGTGILLVVSSGLVLLLVVPATLISYLVVRRATRRLEHLAAATGALRAGDLEARVAVAGEDEVARLQTDFNAMATDLAAAVRDLRAERDTVARLLQDRRELVAAVSHELRTPVATLRAYLEAALDYPPPAPSVAGADPLHPALRHDLTVMARETVRLQRLIDDLFALSRAAAGRLPLVLEPVDAGALLARCAAAAAPGAWDDRRVRVLLTFPDRAVLVQADAGRLEQVVRNLLANAVRHTPPGGLVRLSATTGPGAGPGDALLRVEDTGEGIDPADIDHIWERFYRGAGAAGGPTAGAGLGLALVKELTEAMRGAVDVRSTPGEGSVFTVRLPRPAPGCVPPPDPPTLVTVLRQVRDRPATAPAQS